MYVQFAGKMNAALAMAVLDLISLVHFPSFVIMLPK
jgi:hypothetical protein